jgi:hypothetical protein
MKKISVIFVLCFVIATSSLLAQIKVNSSGYVGIYNNNPTYRLDVSGTVRFAHNSKSVAYDGTSIYPLSTNVDLGAASNYWYRLYSTYEFFSTAPVVESDRDFKINIADLTSMKDKVMSLRPVSYQLNPDFEGISIDKTKNNPQFGFIAQELQEIFPDMVVKDENGLLGIRYTELIPVLVKAIKEQEEEIDALNKRITELEKAVK